MGLSIRPLTEADLTVSFCSTLNRTSQKLVNRSLWSVALLRRLFFRRTELGMDNLLYLCTSVFQKVEYHCVLVNYRDVVMGRPDQYGWDLAGRWLFYDTDLLEAAPFKKVRDAIRKVAPEQTDVHYGALYIPGKLSPEAMVKSLKGNYRPHVFGAKSQAYNVSRYVGMAAVAVLTEATMCFGIQRAERFQSEGQHDVMPELYDIPLQLCGLSGIPGVQVGAIRMTCSETGNLIGVLSFYLIVGRNGHHMLYLHEMIYDPDPKWKPLSVATLLHILAIEQVRQLAWTCANGGTTLGHEDLVVLFGYNLAEGYQSYKEAFRPTADSFPIFTDMHDAPGIMLPCFKDA